MADYTTRNTMAAAAVADPAKVAENFYSPVVGTPDTIEVMNGHLDSANVAVGQDLIQRDVQVGTFIRAGQVGGNAAFDVFDDLFGRTDYNADQGVAADEERDLVAIPGACIRFYVPPNWAANYVIFTWSCFWATDLVYTDRDSPTLCAPVHFRVDRTQVQAFAHRRVALHSIFDMTPGTPEDARRDARIDQRWVGHYTQQNMTPGWHTAGLYIGVSDAATSGPNGLDVAQQARVRSRSMRYIAFRG